METTSKALGVLGETLAFSFLNQRGYKVLLKNYTSPLGEIDLIARRGEWLVFIEVKARSSEAMGHPAEAVTFHKRRQVVKSAQYYMKRYGIRDIPCRFDVVSLILIDGYPPQIELIEDAFGEK